MVSVLALSVEDCGLELKTIKLIFVASPLCMQAALRSENKDCWARNQHSGATCLPADCCISELALY
jgi:hypothetical protein